MDKTQKNVQQKNFSPPKHMMFINLLFAETLHGKVHNPAL